MPIKNYSTSIAEEKTVGEITGLLAVKGARSVQIDYDERGRPKSIAFIVAVKTPEAPEFGVPIPFQLPCNFDGVFNAMRKQFKDGTARARFERNPESRNQARRVAWRIVKDWVAAQMALIDADQASLVQVFLPYAVMEHTATGTCITAFDKFLQSTIRQHALTAGTAPAE